MQVLVEPSTQDPFYHYNRIKILGYILYLVKLVTYGRFIISGFYLASKVIDTGVVPRKAMTIISDPALTVCGTSASLNSQAHFKTGSRCIEGVEVYSQSVSAMATSASPSGTISDKLIGLR